MPRFLLHIPAVLFVPVDAPDAETAAACGERLREQYRWDATPLGRPLADPTPSAEVRVRADASFQTLEGAPGTSDDIDVVRLD